MTLGGSNTYVGWVKLCKGTLVSLSCIRSTSGDYFGRRLAEYIGARILSACDGDSCNDTAWHVICKVSGLLGSIMVIRLVTFLALAIPGFWVGLLLLYLFGVKLQLVSVTNTNGFSAYVLPAVTLALWICGLYIRRLRNAILEVSRQPFVQGGASIGLARMDGLHPLHIPSCGTYVVAYDGGNYGRYARWVCRY